MVGFGEVGDPVGGGGEQDPVPGLAGADRQADGEVGLAGAWRSDQKQAVVACGSDFQRAPRLRLSLDVGQVRIGRRLDGAGADMAAWVSYAMAKKFSKEPEKFGTGHPEGLVEAGAANNASLASGWVPSLLFGIPGDTITAIAIGVLYMKGLNPGPTLFTERASSMYALYLIFILANIIMIPLGILMIRLATRVLRAPRAAVMPVIMPST